MLDGQVVDDGSDASYLGSIGCGERAGGFAADVAVEGGDAVLYGGLDGFGAECAVACNAALQCCTEGGVVSRRRGALAAGEGQGQRERGDGGYEAWRGKNTFGVHETPFSCVERGRC